MFNVYPFFYKNYANLFCMSCIVLKKFCLPLVYPWYRIAPCHLRVLISLRSNDYCMTGSYAIFTMWLLYDYYTITMWFISLAYPFGILSVSLRSGIGMVRGESMCASAISANTFSDIHGHSQKVRRDSFRHPFSLKISTSSLYTQYGGNDVCGGNFRHFATSATCHFLTMR